MKTRDSELIRQTLPGRREPFAALVDHYRDGLFPQARSRETDQVTRSGSP